MPDLGLSAARDAGLSEPLARSVALVERQVDRARHAQPPAAERARTVAARPAASLHGLGLGICQLWGATTTDAGDVLLVVPTDGVVTTALRDSPLGDVPARLTVTDRTPFPPTPTPPGRSTAPACPSWSGSRPG